jgi:hypothetical protein
MESIDKTLECIFQSMILVEESKDQMLECLGIAGEEKTGATPSEESTKLDGRIKRGDSISMRLQHVHLDMGTILGELDKI